MTRKCVKCHREVEGVPSALPQCGNTELPATKFECSQCETVETIATGDPWRPSLLAALPPAKVEV